MLGFSNFKELVGKYSECMEVFRLQEERENKLYPLSRTF